ncbi:hypothetical protein Tco_0312574, partial [Tanacetum coccineum]
YPRNHRSKGLVESLGNINFLANTLNWLGVNDVHRLWDDHYDSLSEDFTRQYQNAHLGRSMVLKDINIYTQSMGKSVDDFDLPELNPDLSMQFRGF